MGKDEMKAFVLRLLQKERAIWKLWLAEGNPNASQHQERVEAAERAFLEAMGDD